MCLLEFLYRRNIYRQNYSQRGALVAPRKS